MNQRDDLPKDTVWESPGDGLPEAIPLTEGRDDAPWAVQIGQRVAALPRVPAPADFNDLLRVRLQQEQAKISFRLWRFFFGPLELPHRLLATRRECSFYFMMAGIFYALLGMAFMLGLRKMGGNVAVGHWILVQPIVAYVTALGLVVSGVLLLKGDVRVLKIIHGIMRVAIILLMVNGVILQRAFGIPVTAPMIFAITGVGMLIISLLDAIINGYLKTPQMEIQKNDKPS